MNAYQITLLVVQTIFTAVAGAAAAFASYWAFRQSKTRIKVDEDEKEILRRKQQMLDEASGFKEQVTKAIYNTIPYSMSQHYSQVSPPLRPSEASLFDRRRAHYAPEKEILAETIVEKVSKQIEENEKLTIILVLDAGSTVFPIFQQLCVNPIFQFEQAKAKRLKIVTNNLPGVSQLIKYGRIGDPIVAQTLFQCRILSGWAHAPYEASLSHQTAGDLLAAIDELKESTDGLEAKQIKVISVTTGNYLNVDEGILARDIDHIDTKSKMIEVGDEVYVLAPLGKFLPYTCQEINDLLVRKGEAGYRMTPKWVEKPNNIYLVVTTRRPEYFAQLKPPELNIYFSRV